MMHEHGKSDSAIVAAKPTNKAGRPAAEPVERRAGTKGNAGQHSRAGHSTGKACPKRWVAYDKSLSKGRRNGSPRSSTMSASTCSGWRSSRSSETRQPAWTG